MSQPGPSGPGSLPRIRDEVFWGESGLPVGAGPSMAPLPAASLLTEGTDILLFILPLVDVSMLSSFWLS